MPLTEFQRRLLAVLAAEPSGDRYLAGGAALNFAPNSMRYSDDLDFFHDSEERVARAYTTAGERFVLPRNDAPLDAQGIMPHFGTPGGVIPRVVEP